jgi:hypothetical protein
MNWKKSLQSPLVFVGLLLFSTLISACGGGDEDAAKKLKAPPQLSVDVLQTDQTLSLGSKTPDGQYLILRTQIKNLGNKPLLLLPADFMLQNITDKDAERYSQPAEKFMGMPFSATYGNALRDKLVDTAPINAYPRLQLERYFVFMVPVEARPKQYQLLYKPFELASPLVSGKTIVHDNRYNTPANQSQ